MVHYHLPNGKRFMCVHFVKPWVTIVQYTRQLQLIWLANWPFTDPFHRCMYHSTNRSCCIRRSERFANPHDRVRSVIDNSTVEYKQNSNVNCKLLEPVVNLF